MRSSLRRCRARGRQTPSLACALASAASVVASAPESGALPSAGATAPGSSGTGGNSTGASGSAPCRWQRLRERSRTRHEHLPQQAAPLVVLRFGSTRQSTLRALDLDDHRLDVVVEARRSSSSVSGMTCASLARSWLARIISTPTFMMASLTMRSEKLPSRVVAVDDGRDDRRDAQPRAPTRRLRSARAPRSLLARVLAPAVVDGMASARKTARSADRGYRGTTVRAVGLVDVRSNIGSPSAGNRFST